MDFRILGKALKFAFLPTLSVLVCVWFAVLSITDVFEFMLSNSRGAITTRIVLLVAEVLIVVFMYRHYLEKELIEGKPKVNWNESSVSRIDISYATDWKRSDDIKYYKIGDTLIIKNIEGNK